MLNCRGGEEGKCSSGGRARNALEEKENSGAGRGRGRRGGVGHAARGGPGAITRNCRGR